MKPFSNFEGGQAEEAISSGNENYRRLSIHILPKKKTSTGNPNTLSYPNCAKEKIANNSIDLAKHNDKEVVSAED